MTLTLTMGCWDYDRVRPLLDRTVQPEGIELDVQIMRPAQSFDRMVRHGEFDIAEMFLAPYMVMCSRGAVPFVALPVFLSRAFRHDIIFINTAAGITEPADLKRKRVGVPRYDSTTAVFVRGMLQHEYGIHPEDVTWVWGDQDHAGDGPSELTIPDLPQTVILEHASAGRTLSGMLETGELDALIAIRIPGPFRRRSPTVRRLFVNPKLEAQRYYRRTGIFPIMHTVVVRKALLEEYPWVAASLYRAFLEAKTQAIGRLYDTDALLITLPFLIDHLEESRRTFGEDYWPYGIEPNRTTLEALAGYLAEQHLAHRKIELDELFSIDT